MDGPKFTAKLKKEKKKKRESLVAVKSIVNTPRFWAVLEFSVKAFSFLSAFAREIDRGKMNIFIVTPGWLKLVDEIEQASMKYPNVLNVEDLPALKKSIADDFLKYHSPAFGLAFLLAPCLIVISEKLQAEQKDVFIAMVESAKTQLTLLQRRFDPKQQGEASNPLRDVPVEEKELLLLQFDQ